MEDPPSFPPPGRNDLIALAAALLYAEPTEDAHKAVLSAVLFPVPGQKRLARLSHKTLLWCCTRPQPRMHLLLRRMRDDAVCQRTFAKHRLVASLAATPTATPQMRPLPGVGVFPRLETPAELAAWLRIDPGHLLWFADLRDTNSRTGAALLTHYTRRVVQKAGGEPRLLEVPKQQLKRMQRSILEQILTPVPLHPAVHGFRRKHSIVTFAAPHTGFAALLRLDLQDFFPSISGPRVQALFRTLGYPERVADLLGGLCTVCTPKHWWREVQAFPNEGVQRATVLYARPHLPQGAPSSPAIANLCAFRLDRRLAGLAAAAGLTYTRYADDLAFSGEISAPFAGVLTSRITAIVAEEGFSLHLRKTRLMRSSCRQQLAGLVVNTRPTVPRPQWKQMEAILTNCVRKGPQTQNREDHPEFRRSLEGRVAFFSMVDRKRAAHLRRLLQQISWP